MLETIIAFLIMLNPFALFLYLVPVMDELDSKTFMKVLLRATFISFCIYFIFLAAGNFLFENVFQISFEAFRIFGGIIIFSFAYLYIVRGQGALLHVKEDLDDLASEIALPFMVGAGTISISVLMSYKFTVEVGALLLIIILLINYMIILGLTEIKNSIRKKKNKIAFDKNMQVMLRLMGFFVGAIGVNMVVTGILNTFF